MGKVEKLSNMSLIKIVNFLIMFYKIKIRVGKVEKLSNISLVKVADSFIIFDKEFV